MPSTRASSTSASMRAIVQARGEQAEREADADLGAEPLAPPRPRTARSRDSREIVVAQRRVEHLGRDLAADQAVVDAAAGRRLDEAGGITDGEQPRAVRLAPRDRAAGSSAAARASPRRSTPKRARMRAANSAKARRRARLAHQADAAERLRRRGVNGTIHAKPPGATCAAEVDFDLSRARRTAARAARSARTPAARRDRAARLKR